MSSLAGLNNFLFDTNDGSKQSSLFECRDIAFTHEKPLNTAFCMPVRRKEKAMRLAVMLFPNNQLADSVPMAQKSASDIILIARCVRALR